VQKRVPFDARQNYVAALGYNKMSQADLIK
jgi:hypothetical protein